MPVRSSALHAAPRNVLCSALALSLLSPIAIVPNTASATNAATAPSADEAALEEARALFEKGRTKYDTFDYDGAIDIWQEAYAKVPESQAGVRNAMVYNIALAQEKAYEVDKDVAHLRQAVLLLESWVASYMAMFKKTSETEAELAKAQARIDELKARIARIESGTDSDPTADDDEPPPTVLPQFDTGYNPPPEIRKEQEKAKAKNTSEGLIAAGWTVAGVGTLIALAGVGTLTAVESDGGRGGGGGALGLGAIMMITGGVLLGVGYKKKKAIQRGDYTFAPYGTPQGGGAAFGMRF